MKMTGTVCGYGGHQSGSIKQSMYGMTMVMKNLRRIDLGEPGDPYGAKLFTYDNVDEDSCETETVTDYEKYAMSMEYAYITSGQYYTDSENTTWKGHKCTKYVTTASIDFYLDSDNRVIGYAFSRDGVKQETVFKYTMNAYSDDFVLDKCGDEAKKPPEEIEGCTLIHGSGPAADDGSATTSVSILAVIMMMLSLLAIF